jgi:nucleotide-binding universal stress UspA family protein
MACAGTTALPERSCATVSPHRFFHRKFTLLFRRFFLKVLPQALEVLRYTGAIYLSCDNNVRLKLDTVLVATDFSSASQMAMAYATSIARRHGSKLLIAHVVSSQSERAVMDGWRAGQIAVTEYVIAGRLEGIEHQLVVKPGDVWPVLAQMVSEHGVDLIVVGTHGRTGVRKLILGSVAESIFRQSPCPVLTIGPNADQDPKIGPERILTSTGFAPHSLRAVRYAVLLAQEMHSSLALLHVVTDPGELNVEEKERLKKEREARLRDLVPGDVHLADPACFFVEFGSATDKILATASEWNANLIVLGLRHVEEGSRGESTWARAYEIVRQARCPVMTIRMPK